MARDAVGVVVVFDEGGLRGEGVAAFGAEEVVGVVVPA